MYIAHYHSHTCILILLELGVKHPSYPLSSVNIMPVPQTGGSIDRVSVTSANLGIDNVRYLKPRDEVMMLNQPLSSDNTVEDVTYC